MIKFEELFKNIMSKVVARPFDETRTKDGNWNYIHQTDVSNAMVEVRRVFTEIENAQNERTDEETIVQTLRRVQPAEQRALFLEELMIEIYNESDSEKISDIAGFAIQSNVYMKS
jgi:hypothetical protein